jgi:peroxiredoxin
LAAALLATPSSSTPVTTSQTLRLNPVDIAGIARIVLLFYYKSLEPAINICTNEYKIRRTLYAHIREFGAEVPAGVSDGCGRWFKRRAQVRR